MSTNRASFPDTLTPTPHGEVRRVRAGVSDPDTSRRTVLTAAGLVIALVSLALGTYAIAQVWLAPAAADGVAQAPTLQPWETLTMIVLGGIGFAGGAALVGIGMGRWTSPRPPGSDADYTGPGEDPEDMPEPPRVV
jgi:hypothetical protein